MRIYVYVFIMTLFNMEIINLNFNLHKYDRVIKHTFNSLPENISI